MQRHRVCAAAAVCWSLSLVSVLGQGTTPQLPTESVYPRFAARGQSTVINVAVPSPEAITRAEVSPAAGVAVASIKGEGSGSEQNVGWWEITLDVAADAAPGDRTLVLETASARTAPVTIAIATHAPAISDLRAVAPQAAQYAVDLQLTAMDAASDLGDSPYVWFTANCGGDPIVGALRGRVAGSVVRVALPNVRRSARDGIAPTGMCDVQARVSDAAGIESNTLKTRVEFADAAASPAPVPADEGAVPEWIEFASPDERFAVTFPGQPKISDTAWTSQFGAILPARVYNGPQGPSRYSVTVVDYRPVQRLLTERSRTLPALDLAVHDYGPGYWKTDLRGAAAYAASQFLRRDAKMTSVLSSWADLVQGLVLELTNNADQSRTYASIYLHENRLIVTEATVPRGYPAPLIFEQSLGWLDASGQRVRYQYSYHNDPDIPPPPSRLR